MKHEPPPRSRLRAYGPALLYLGALILVCLYLFLAALDLHVLHP